MDENKKYPKPYSPAWNKLKNNLAEQFLPVIYPCQKCNYPVVDGYCCGGCGDGDPKHRAS